MINIKPKLFIDFDSTICDSTSSFCQTYTDLYSFRQGFKEPNPSECNRWDLKDVAPLVENPQDIFSSRRFFSNLQFFPNAKEILLKLTEKFDITIVSIGTYENISHKAMWINTYLPFIHNTILIANEGCKMDKSIIDMGSNETLTYFIDDHEDNLFGSEADYRYLFGVAKPWNERWRTLHKDRWLKNWDEVAEELFSMEL